MADLSKLSDADLLALAHQKISAPAPVDPTEGMSAPQRLLAGVGKSFHDAAQGIRQGVTEGMDYLTGGNQGSDLRRETDEERALTAPLTKTGAGMTGNILGNVAMFAPTAAIPGANTYTGAALTGALMGATSPVGENDSRLLNTAVGGAAGVSGQAVGRGLARALQPVQSALSPEEAALAAAAEREGIPLRASQATGSKPLAIAESVMENLPFTSGSQLAGKQAQKDAFQRAVLARAGITGETAATPEVLAAQKATVGKALGDIAERNSLDFNQGLTDKLSGIVDDATKHLPPTKAAQVAEQVDQILSQVDEKGAMAGTNYQGWREPLRSLAKKGDEFSRYYGQIRGALDDAFKTQLPGAEGEAFRDLSGKYANVKTIANAMGGSSADAAVGNIPPAQLSAALSQSVGREGKALGRGDLNELSRIGRRFISPNVPDSGTAQRQLYTSLLTRGGGGAGIGAISALASGHDPLEGAGYGLAAGGASLVAPKLVQALMNSGVGQEYLKKGAVALTASQRGMIANALRTAAITGTATRLAQ